MENTLPPAPHSRSAGAFSAYAVKPDGTVTEFPVSTGALTEAERQIIADGCLINYYRNNQ